MKVASSATEVEYLPFRVCLPIRLVLTGYYVCAWIWDFVQQYPTFGDNENIYTDYLTNWGSCCLLLHLLISVSYVPLANFTILSPVGLQRYRTVNRTFAELALTSSILVTAAYWALLGAEEKEEIKFGFMNIHEHVLNTCIAGISFLMLDRVYCWWWHVIWCWLFGVLYALSNYLSYLGNNKRNNVYGMLNWEDLHQFPEKFYGTLEIVSILIFAGLTTVYAACFGVDIIKSRIISRFKSPAVCDKSRDRCITVRTVSTSL